MNLSKPENLHSKRPAVNALTAVSDLRHFAIISFAIPAERLRALIPACFELDTIVLNGQHRALLSVVSFLNTGFRSARIPLPRFTIGQTNYRVYIRDPQGRRAVWFLGTVLDSWTLFVPRNYWRLPWHRGQMRFEGTDQQYQLRTRSSWAPMHAQFRATPATPQYPGFADSADGQMCLTQPLVGYYYRRDGQLGSYAIWHAPLKCQTATVTELSIGLLARWGLVSPPEQAQPYSVLLTAQSQFTIYLPPHCVKQAERMTLKNQ